MLSIMIFKNMYPEEFALLQGTEGIIKKAYSDKSDFIKRTSVDLQKEIEDAEEEKRKSDSQEILHAEDVKLAFMRKIGEEVDIDDAESAIEDASVPALFKVFSDNETYNKTIEALLELDVLHINHKNEGCVEYIIDDKDIEVKLIKKKNSLDGIVNVGGYIVDIYIPNVGEGYQEFMRKYDSKSAYDEAVLLLVSPVEVTQITFMKNNICKIER